MSRESDLTQLWLKWVESELSQVSKFGLWVESELSQVSKFGSWVESELSHMDCHMSQSRVSPKKWVEHNPGTGSPTLYRLSYGTDNASEMLWEGNVAHDARGLSLCHQRCTIWNNYEFIFIGTQTHLPQKLFFPRISVTLFRKCLKMQHFKTRQEKKFLKYPHF